MNEPIPFKAPKVKRLVPQCPKCGKRSVLVLSKDRKIRCMKDAGGCGEEFPITRLPSLYVEVEE